MFLKQTKEMDLRMAFQQKCLQSNGKSSSSKWSQTDSEVVTKGLLD